MLSDKLTGYETLLVFLHVLKQVLISKKKKLKKRHRSNETTVR